MPEPDGTPLPFFSAAEHSRIDGARRAVQPQTATVAYCLYESPFARSGGLFAVADNYAAALSEQGRDVVVLAPYHSALQTAPTSDQVEQVGSCEVPFGGRRVPVSLFEHRRHGVRWCLLRSEGYFDAAGGPGGNDPYSYFDPGKLLLDSLFLCAAIPQALDALGLRRNLIVHLQDWELASAALSVKTSLLEGVLETAAVVLTSHNPYDHGLPSESLEMLSARTSGKSDDETVFQHMIPLVDGPLTTVSEGFARELISDPLQTGHFANHLQHVFHERGVVGIDNGLFGSAKRAFSEHAIEQAAGQPELILSEKRELRRALIEVVSQLDDQRIIGSLDADGGTLEQLPEDVPILLMFGRLDPGQKGFDVFTRAIEALPRRTARYIITPLANDVADAYVEDLFALPSRRPGEVVVLPFRLEQGYAELLAGASYVVMPSLYEPFGGATEAYLAGTPVVARDTGGLAQQVIDVGQSRDSGTGLLYRESEPGNQEAWSAIETASTPHRRTSVPTYESMVESCTQALVRACAIYRDDPGTYGKMLANLYNRANHFSWDRAIQQYAEIYRRATR